MKERFHQVSLIVAFLPLCWLWMMAIHELGHVLAAIASGGAVSKVVLHPLAISRTDVAVNPAPLRVVWAGPCVGVVLPLATTAIACAARFPWAYLLRFFGGFCLIANGCYVGIGAFSGIGDSGEMLKGGSPIWLLWLFGLVAVPLGLYLWNGLGPHFGLGPAKGKVDHRVAYLCIALLVLTVLLEVVFSSR